MLHGLMNNPVYILPASPYAFKMWYLIQHTSNSRSNYSNPAFISTYTNCHFRLQFS